MTESENIRRPADRRTRVALGCCAVLLAAYAVLPLAAPDVMAAIVGPIAPEYVREQVPTLARGYPAWDWTHRVGCAALVLVGLSQVSRAWTRHRAGRVAHKVAGRLYVALVLLAATGGLWMVLTAPFDPSEVLPTFVYAGLLVGFTSWGIASAECGDVAGHRRAMRRSYAVVLGPLFVRVAYVPAWAPAWVRPARRDGSGVLGRVGRTAGRARVDRPSPSGYRCRMTDVILTLSPDDVADLRRAVNAAATTDAVSGSRPDVSVSEREVPA